jgi:TetR/AcrR family transcriptional regulator
MIGRPPKSSPDHILDAAQKRFARLGLSGTTMEEIASDVGTSKASLYYYFRTKEKIFREVIAREQREFLGRIKALLRTRQSPGRKIQEYLRHRFRFFSELMNLNILSIQALVEVRPFVGDLFRDFRKQERMLIIRLIREGRASGEFACASPAGTADLILHVWQGIRMQFLWKSPGITPDAKALRNVEKESRLLADVLLNGILSNHRRKQAYVN